MVDHAHVKHIGLTAGQPSIERAQLGYDKYVHLYERWMQARNPRSHAGSNSEPRRNYVLYEHTAP